MALAPQLASLVAVKSLGASDTQVAILAAARELRDRLWNQWTGTPDGETLDIEFPAG